MRRYLDFERGGIAGGSVFRQRRLPRRPCRIPGARESQNLFDDLSSDPAGWKVAIAAEGAERIPTAAALITRPFDYGSVTATPPPFVLEATRFSDASLYGVWYGSLAPETTVRARCVTGTGSCRTASPVRIAKSSPSGACSTCAARPADRLARQGSGLLRDVPAAPVTRSRTEWLNVHEQDLNGLRRVLRAATAPTRPSSKPSGRMCAIGPTYLLIAQRCADMFAANEVCRAEAPSCTAVRGPPPCLARACNLACNALSVPLRVPQTYGFW